MTTRLDLSGAPQHIVLSGVSWSYYEHTLQEVARQPVRVAYLDGMMEIMSILPEHEAAKKAIAELIAILATENRIPRKSFGSMTFRREEKQTGSEPDESFYFHEIESIKRMKRFDPLVHRAPDLWIEVDIFSPSVAREPIYARLGVPELWRYNGDQLAVRLLASDGNYADSTGSKLFPFLAMNQFASFIPRWIEGDETEMTIEFREWVRALPR